MVCGGAGRVYREPHVLRSFDLIEDERVKVRLARPLSDFFFNHYEWNGCIDVDRDETLFISLLLGIGARLKPDVDENVIFAVINRQNICAQTIPDCGSASRRRVHDVTLRVLRENGNPVIAINMMQTAIALPTLNINTEVSSSGCRRTVVARETCAGEPLHIGPNDELRTADEREGLRLRNKEHAGTD